MPDQPLGPPVDFTGAPAPVPSTLTGRYTTLRPLDVAQDAGELYAVAAPAPALWTYLPYGPYPDQDAFTAYLQASATSPRELFFSVLVDGRARGVASYCNIVPADGNIEIGHIWFAPSLQRTRPATEAIYLLMGHAFGLGYRRVEWRCNALNAPSRNAAERFGFVYEGTIAQHRVVKGRNRDTAWFGMTDGDWPAIRAAFEAWLAPDNFDAQGHQLTALAARSAR